MAKQDTFTSDEWTLLRLAPSFVAVGISAADPSGLYSSIKEVIAGTNAMIETLEANSGLELFSALAADRSLVNVPDLKALIGKGSNEQQMQSFRYATLEHVKTATAILARKASASESDAYRQLLMSVARKTANAAKEGGFLGIGGVRVSAKEQQFINAVSRAAGID
jgi:hypothetical protein